MISCFLARSSGSVHVQASRRTTKIANGTRRISPRPTSRVTQRWHTYVEEPVVKEKKSVEELKAAVEARLAQGPKLADFLAESENTAPEASSGSCLPHHFIHCPLLIHLEL